ncbi:3'5'-cyclic nucleotide phosphodiesterase, partial [Kipferlia bialata]
VSDRGSGKEGGAGSGHPPVPPLSPSRLLSIGVTPMTPAEGGLLDDASDDDSGSEDSFSARPPLPNLHRRQTADPANTARTVELARQAMVQGQSRHSVDSPSTATGHVKGHRRASSIPHPSAGEYSSGDRGSDRAVGRGVSNAWSIVPGHAPTLGRDGFGTLMDSMVSHRHSFMAPPDTILRHIRDFKERLSSAALAHKTQHKLEHLADFDVECMYVNSLLTLSFDAHLWARDQGRLAMPYLGFLLHHFYALQGVVSVRRFCAALVGFNNLYRDSSMYHNSVHAADVLQMVAMMVHKTRMTAAGRTICPLHAVCVILLAAAAHDVEHCGVSSDLLVNTRHALYLVYGTVSTLEKYHVALGVYVLRYYGVFDLLPKQEAEQKLDLFRLLVLSTDPKTLFESINQLNNLHWDAPTVKLMGGKGLQSILLCSIMRMGDISNASRPFPVAKAHSLNVMAEFFHTGDLETNHGLKLGTFRDRSEGSDGIRRCQGSFIESVVKRYTKALTAFCRSLAQDGKASLRAQILEETPYTLEALQDPLTGTMPLATLLETMLSAMEENQRLWAELPDDDFDLVECLHARWDE